MTRIKEVRTKLGITASEAARRIGISRQRYSLYERGVNQASYEMLTRMSEAFGCSVDYLVGKESTPAEIRRSALIDHIMNLPEAELRALFDDLFAQSVPVDLPGPTAEAETVDHTGQESGESDQ